MPKTFWEQTLERAANLKEPARPARRPGRKLTPAERRASATPAAKAAHERRMVARDARRAAR
jgi:hypothetical protein